MSERTQNYGLSMFENAADGKISDDGFKYTGADRVLMDLLLKRALNHHHTGGSATLEAPTEAPELEVETTGGTIQAGVRVFYKYTLVDADGFESPPSPETYIDTPAAIATPGTPTLETDSGGNLLPGAYYYKMSAYVTATTLETAAGPAGYITLVNGATDQVTITFPTLPAGADGWNIYRLAPGGTSYYLLDSVDMTGGSPPDSYVDDGNVDPNLSRVAPTLNTTNNSNSITITYPGATPTVPTGYTWKIYRTFITNQYSDSLLKWVVEEVTPGVVEPSYVDEGGATLGGAPPSTTVTIDNPDPIDLVDDVDGRLPMGHVQAYPYLVQFRVSEPVVASGTNQPVWVCEFPSATIMWSRISLGRSSTPSQAIMIVDINKYDTAIATPTWATIYTTQANRPRLVVADSVGDRTVPDVTSLVEGDLLSFDIDQDGGGGATPTDHELLITVCLLVQFENETDVLSWS